MRQGLLFEGKNVLLVEDELVVAEKVAQQLTALGFSEVLSATTLSQAHEILDRQDVSIALLDVNLAAGETTIELGWALSGDNIPVVFISGFNAEDMARLTRGHEFMEKPISLSRLKRALHRAMLRAPSQKQTFGRKKMAGQVARQ
ncbi:MAG: response regulator [Pseudomonadota bacterium]